MKLICTLLTSIALAPIGTLSAAEPPAPNELILSFAGGSVWTGATTGTCLWYFPVLRGVEFNDLFEDPASPSRGTAHLIWVSDFRVQFLEQGTAGTYTRVLVPTGTATVYYSEQPGRRVFSKDLADRSTWGTPVARFTRQSSVLWSPDGFATDRFVFSAELTWSAWFHHKHKWLNFKELVPHGMTCFEEGLIASSSEAGSCLAMGAARWF